MFSSFAQTRTSGKLSANSKVLPIKSEAIKVHTISGFVENNIGPG
jgi:hypothetical protein